jgi:amidohydrolase
LSPGLEVCHQPRLFTVTQLCPGDSNQDQPQNKEADKEDQQEVQNALHYWTAEIHSIAPPGDILVRAFPPLKSFPMATVHEEILPQINLDDLTRQIHPEVVQNRRHLHSIPEIGLQEFQTADYIESQLDKLGLSHERCTPTGVVSLIDSGQPGPTVMLRADIDALPIIEDTGHEYISTRPGFMHACGHDTHTAMQLGVARRLLSASSVGRGRIKLVFQPGEEGHHGAEKMIEAGVLDNPKPDFAYGQHIWAQEPTGKILIQGGPVMAGVDRLEITLTGKGTHAAYPHGGIDPILAAAQVITALQSIVSRNVDPKESAVVTVAVIHAGTAHNIIPQTVEMVGTVRWFDEQIHEIVRRRIHEVVEGVGSAMGCKVEVRYIAEHFPTVNDFTIAEIVHEEAVQIVGEENVIPRQMTMGAEDMSDFLRQVPGAFAFVGGRCEKKECVYPHHHPKFNVDEDAFAIGAELMYRVAQRLLAL